MAPLDADDDAVERRQLALELEPRLAAPPGRVRRVDALEHQAFVAALARGVKALAHVIPSDVEGPPLSYGDRDGPSTTRRFAQDDTENVGEDRAPRRQRFVEQEAFVARERVEDDVAHRHLGQQLRRDVLALQPRLQIAERQHAPVAFGDDLAVERERAGSARSAATISGYDAATSLSVREKSETRSGVTCACARMPSYLSSTSQLPVASSLYAPPYAIGVASMNAIGAW